MHRKGRLKHDDEDKDEEQTRRGSHMRHQKKAPSPPFDAEEAQVEHRTSTPSISPGATTRTRRKFGQLSKKTEPPSKSDGQQQFDAEEAQKEPMTVMRVSGKEATKTAVLASRKATTSVRGTSLREEEKVEEVARTSLPYADDDYDPRPGAERVGGFSSTTRANDDDTVMVGGASTYDAPVGPSPANVVARAQLVEDPVVAAEVGADQSGELKQRLDQSETSRRRIIRISICVVLFFVALVVGLVTYFVAIRDNGDDSTATPTSAPTPDPTTAPTTPAPTPDPTTAAPTTPAPTSLRESWIQLMQSRMPSITFDNSTSPEGKALDWLVEDSYTISLANEDRIVQRFALAVLFYSTDGPTRWRSENRDGWLQPSWECGWGEPNDVGCNNANVVESVLLGGAGLFGNIPKEVGLLLAATRLNLSASNGISGPLPTELGNLSKLTWLSLYNANISGPIPTELGSLSKLTRLDLFLTNLSGPLPTELGNLSNLEVLHLRNTNLSGPLPTELANLPLHTLGLSDTNLSGSIPFNLCRTLESARIDCDEIECECCTHPPPLETVSC